MLRLAGRPLLLLAAAAVLLATAAAAAAERASTSEALAYLKAHRASAAQDLIDLASFPTISAQPEHTQDILKAAEWLKQRLTAAGLENAQILPTEGPQPVVYAEWLHAGPQAPTVLVYAHYDVQPADPIDLWDSPPFSPSLEGGHFHGRGVDDDKGGLLQALHGVEAFLRAGGGGGPQPRGLPVNVKFLLEGQEEVGSPHLEAFLRRHAGGLLAGADLAVSADGGQISERQPGISTGLRGAAALEVVVTTAKADLHSGIKGGSVQNANHALVQLLASLRAPATGRVAVRGFYDDVAPMNPDDERDAAAFPFSEEDEAAALGLAGGASGLVGEEGFSTLARRWHRPTLEVVGMSGGYSGPGLKTVLPCTAVAKLSCRLVPNQSPGRVAALVREHLEAHAPPAANVTVQVLGFRAHPWVSPRDTPGNRVAAAVLERVYGTPPVYYRDGGTIPALAYFQEELHLNSTIFAHGLGENIHAPNERLLESMFHRGAEAWVELLAEMGERLPGLMAAEARGGGGGSGGKDEL